MRHLLHKHIPNVTALGTILGRFGEHYGLCHLSKLTILVWRLVYFNGFIILSAFYLRDYWNAPVFNL